MQKDYLGDKAALVPEKYWSQFVCVGSASDWHYFFRKIIPKDKRKVLIVGVHGGRDFFYFKTEGYDVRGQDLFPESDFGEIIVGNIEDVRLPEQSFDVVVASAVIEHVNNDCMALKNIRRALKDDGIFIVCVPLYNDWEITHMHIYSRESIRRLAESSGFSIQESFAYPNLFFFPAVFNVANHALNAIVFTLFKKTVYAYTLPPLWKIEYFLSRQHSLLFRAFRRFLGAFNNGTFLTVVCRKDKFKDQVNFNKMRFEPQKMSAHQ
ncbi:MAG: class I SAM-dependent methyltransferase [Candidatus Jorgensenbacteria bacterium]